jgi:L-threonylcarbamoyladenylate synthase
LEFRIKMNNIIEIDDKYTDEIIDLIADNLIKKKIIIMPSDTIYGFLALPSCEKRITEIKKRDNKPFLYLISDLKQLDLIGIEKKFYRDILNKYWPGPITFIMKCKNKKAEYSILNDTIGIRMPNWDILLKIIAKTGKPLISTSVNYSGENPIEDIDEIIEKFSLAADLIISDRNIKKSVSSTIVDISEKPYKILRNGSGKFNEI